MGLLKAIQQDNKEMITFFFEAGAQPPQEEGVTIKLSNLCPNLISELNADGLTNERMLNKTAKILAFIEKAMPNSMEITSAEEPWLLAVLIAHGKPQLSKNFTEPISNSPPDLELTELGKTFMAKNILDYILDKSFDQKAMLFFQKNEFFDEDEGAISERVLPDFNLALLFRIYTLLKEENSTIPQKEIIINKAKELVREGVSIEKIKALLDPESEPYTEFYKALVPQAVEELSIEETAASLEGGNVSNQTTRFYRELLSDFVIEGWRNFDNEDVLRFIIRLPQNLKNSLLIEAAEKQETSAIRFLCEAGAELPPETSGVKINISNLCPDSFIASSEPLTQTIFLKLTNAVNFIANTPLDCLNFDKGEKSKNSNLRFCMLLTAALLSNNTRAIKKLKSLSPKNFDSTSLFNQIINLLGNSSIRREVMAKLLLEISSPEDKAYNLFNGFLIACENKMEDLAIEWLSQSQSLSHEIFLLPELTCLLIARANGCKEITRNLLQQLPTDTPLSDTMSENLKKAFLQGTLETQEMIADFLKTTPKPSLEFRTILAYHAGLRRYRRDDSSVDQFDGFNSSAFRNITITSLQRLLKTPQEALLPQTEQTLQTLLDGIKNRSLSIDATHKTPGITYARMARELNPGQEFIVNIQVFGHALLMSVKKQPDGNFLVTRYNTARRESIEPGQRDLLIEQVKDVPANDIYNPDLWSEINKNTDSEVSSFTYAIRRLIAGGKITHQPDILRQMPQEKGVCVAACMMAKFRHDILTQSEDLESNKIQFKLFKALWREQLVNNIAEVSEEEISTLEEEGRETASAIRRVHELAQVALQSSKRYLQFATISKNDAYFIHADTILSRIIGRDAFDREELLSKSYDQRILYLRDLYEEAVRNIIENNNNPETYKDLFSLDGNTNELLYKPLQARYNKYIEHGTR